MKSLLPILAAVLAGIAGSAFHAPASAWASANRYGGHTTSGFGQTSHTNAYGGSTTHNWDGGTTHTNAAGGTTTGMYGAGAVHTTNTGYSTYHPPAYSSGAYYHPPAYGYPGYAPYHPPYPVYSSGCYNCAGAVAAGAVVGLAAGAAIASNNAAIAANNQAIATNNAYAAGVAAGATGRTVYAAPSFGMGSNYASLPVNALPVNQNGGNYYVVGNTWFKPAYGANGVYYTVVPTP